MSNYTKTTDFAAKDALTTGDPDKVVKGTEFEVEFDAIAVAVNSKADTASPTFTGTVTAPTVDINAGNIDNTTIGATTPAAATFTDLTVNNPANMSFLIDEDDMASDSAVRLPTQQSVRAYVTTQVASAGIGLELAYFLGSI